MRPAPYSRPMAIGRQEHQADDRRRCRRARLSAGQSARPTSTSQSSRPMNRKICQKRPMSVYSQPWWPNQKLLREAELLHHREPLAGERADDDHDEADEQEVHAEALELRLVARDRGPDVQPRAEPRGGDPQHRELRVPASREAVRQDLGQREAVGVLALDLVVRGRRAEQDLHEEQREHRARSTWRSPASTG